MMGTMAYRQRGLSMLSMLGFVAMVIVAAIIVIKVAPPYIQDKEVKRIFDEVAHNPDMKNAPTREILLAYSKSAGVADVTNVKADDVDVTKDASGITLSANYSVKVPLFGNASLLLEFSTSSSK